MKDIYKHNIESDPILLKKLSKLDLKIMFKQNPELINSINIFIT